MANPTWDETTPLDSEIPTWENTTEIPNVSKVESGLRGAAQGATMGFADELTGAANSLFSDKTYREARDEARQKYDEAKLANPATYTAGELGGAAATALVPGLGEMTIPKLAAQGALYGLGSSKADLTQGEVGQAAKDTAIGGATGAVLGTAGKAVGKVLPWAAKQGLAAIGSETTLADIEKYLSNPEVINSALSTEGVAGKLAESASDIGKASGQLSQRARGMLNPNENTLGLKEIKDSAMNALKKYFPEGKLLTTQDELATKTILDQYGKIAETAGENQEVSLPTLRSILDRMQAATKETTFGNPEASASQQALKEFSGHLNDLLRKTSPEYAEAMAPAAEAAGLSKGLQEGFKLEGGQPTDATYAKLNNLIKSGKPDEVELANQLKNLTGTDITTMLQNAGTKSRFEAPGPGSLLKMIGTTAGYGTGHMTHIPFAGAAGAAAGGASSFAMDGGMIAKNIIDAYMKGVKSTGLQKFGPLLVDAVKRGGNALASTHFVLATSNPEYQQLIEDHQEK